jgi:hypothetical protein
VKEVAARNDHWLGQAPWFQERQNIQNVEFDTQSESQVAYAGYGGIELLLRRAFCLDYFNPIRGLH